MGLRHASGTAAKRKGLEPLVASPRPLHSWPFYTSRDSQPVSGVGAMKLTWIAVPAFTVALAVCGCKNHKVEPVPPPTRRPLVDQSHLRLPARTPAAARLEQRDDDLTADHDGRGMPHGASGISWFQGSFEEGFSIACSCHCYHFGLKP